MIQHNVTHYYQPTNHTCAQTSLAILLSHYDPSITLDYVIENLPKNKDENGDEMGSVVQQLATWCMKQGYDVKITTSDMQILDYNWIGNSSEQIISKLEEVKVSRLVAELGKKWSKVYVDAYIEFLSAGGELEITPYISESKIDEMLERGPLHVCVSQNVFRKKGRTKDVSLRKSVKDDIEGTLTTHSVVIYGKNDKGKYMIADPWIEPGLFEFEPEHIVVSIAAAQIQCDNMIVQIRKR